MDWKTKLSAGAPAFALGVALVGCQLVPQGQQGEKHEKIERVSLPEDGAARQPGEETGWQLVWQDEFEGEEIDRTNWDFDVDCWGGGNEERQCYRDDPSNASVRDGKLVITARNETHTGPALPPHLRAEADDLDATATKPFTSARLVTRGKAAWKYGRIEVRAKLPQGQGTWPAIWMLPEDNVYGGWASSGEIDIMEAVNLGTPCDECPEGVESTILGTLHFGGFWPENSLDSSEMYAPEVLDGFNTFGIIWAPGRIEWTLNGKVFARKDADAWWSVGSDEREAPFDQRFHLILNLAIGGGLPERRGLGGVDERGFPKNLEIDWVRVWKCDEQDDSDVDCLGGE
ncbi:MAG: glycoside hydrolase family 16 protein [Pseudomonadota bacterium]